MLIKHFKKNTCHVFVKQCIVQDRQRKTKIQCCNIDNWYSNPYSLASNIDMVDGTVAHTKTLQLN